LARGTFQVGLVQMSCGPDPEQNLQKALERVGEAAGRGAQVVCLPELFQTQYFCQREDPALFDLAEPIPGPASRRLAEAARRHGVVLLASLFERRAPGVYHNTSVLFDADGGTAGLYRKMVADRHPIAQQMWERERWDIIPGAEEAGAFAARVGEAITRIAAAHPGQRVAVFTHGGVIGQALALAARSRPFAFVGADNGSISRLVITDQRWMIRLFNDTAHLRDLRPGQRPG